MRNRWKLGLGILASFALVACSTQQTEHTDHSQGTHHSHSEKENSDQYHTVWNSQITKPSEEGEIQITIQDHSGKPVPDFEINHEKKMHLLVVKEDLSYFAHVHPDYKGNGHFSVKTKFPENGKYKLIADFIPKGESQVTQTSWVTVGGPTSKQPIQEDKTLTKNVDGKEISLSFDKELKANQKMILTFDLKDAATKQPITNLQQYLGAAGHVVILSEDTNDYLHVHPVDEKSKGPKAQFTTTFPRAGIYKIWGEFQHDGKIITVSYVVKVS